MSGLRVNLLGISGSLRRASTNTAILKAIQPAVSEIASLTIFSLAEVPLYNGDLEGDATPAGVKALREAIAAADGLVLCSPEYNYGVPGVLKNALDWASRPAYTSCLKGKPVLVMTSSPGYFGGVRAQSQLRDTLTGTLSRVVVHPDVALASINHKLADGVLAEDAVRVVLDGVRALVAEIKQQKATATADLLQG